jgi:hypothetical protein
MHHTAHHLNAWGLVELQDLLDLLGKRAPSKFSILMLLHGFVQLAELAAR